MKTKKVFLGKGFKINARAENCQFEFGTGENEGYAFIGKKHILLPMDFSMKLDHVLTNSKYVSFFNCDFTSLINLLRRTTEKYRFSILPERHIFLARYNRFKKEIFVSNPIVIDGHTNFLFLEEEIGGSSYPFIYIPNEFINNFTAFFKKKVEKDDSLEQYFMQYLLTISELEG